MKVTSLKIGQASEKEISPLVCNTHQVHYHIHSSQLYYSFIYLPILQYPQYITREKLSTATVPCYC
jgi:hypothetical protein